MNNNPCENGTCGCGVVKILHFPNLGQNGPSQPLNASKGFRSTFSSMGFASEVKTGPMATDRSNQCLSAHIACIVESASVLADARELLFLKGVERCDFGRDWYWDWRPGSGPLPWVLHSRLVRSVDVYTGTPIRTAAAFRHRLKLRLERWPLVVSRGTFRGLSPASTLLE